MRILCLVKQVSEPESPFDLEQGSLVLRPPARSQMNSYDEYALEAALTLKESLPDCRVCALTVGPASCDTVLQRAMGMGADQVVRLDGLDDGAGPLAVASAVAAWAKEQAFDLILTGVMSQDAMQGAVGPMCAELLGLPWTSSVVELALDQEQRVLGAQREMEGGRRQQVELPLPCMVSLNSGINRPRYPTLSLLLKAKKTPPQVVEAARGPQPRERVIRVSLPGKKRAGLVLPGDTATKAQRLVAILRERALL
ncbi:MAG: electron transfer flavoprotein subunit beta/FixA family protein [Desulfarculaceae bacterium]|nr:electron transfer flavoprotein subunit beta/FixA family protein [Desulfarculaceae bacterium]MCF8071684.1 electron transfer flavoprotein subunit beta/FixA family protein [Desulfarculaceae bacterium]MCF8102469.1 electron transfer flavoprotein subunit beta/FixA family protein [Desulfarculaceae bacterium]MCF8116811.1 electron transfer flavoprotein subunit beta/FixA family protein [Desulfarculaceae bacterium]